ncbi:MAG: AMP-binding protein [Fibrobacteres bacterium]|nr:AMP-binding protein [Fibrobacterota bacterium]
MADSPASGGRAAWRPDGATRSRARLSRFMTETGRPSFEDLYRHSIDDIEGFTAEVLRFLDIRFDRFPDRILDVTADPAHPVWCPGGGLNISRTCLDKHLEAGAGGRLALIWEGEEGPASVRTLGYAELAALVGHCAAGLRACGLGRGDAVGLYLPMLPETVISLLALARIGAVAVPLFSGYGPAALIARLRDVEAKAVITCDAFPRRGKPVNARAALDEAAAACPTLRLIIVAARPSTEAARSGIPESQPGDIPPSTARRLSWNDLLDLGQAPGADASPAPTAAEDPLIVLYTSGTTGKPKGILHTHCGFPVKAAQDMAFGTDVGPGDRITWVTDIGWMMGPWLIYGATILGATLVLYDGAPDFPGPDRLWEFCARHRVGILGISPSLIRACMHRGGDLPSRHDLSALRILASTGEPWDPESWQWFFDKVGGSKLPIINYSGGTEISGGILMGNPLLPIAPCAFSAPCPGMAAEVWGEAGKPVDSGMVGELVIRKPWIGMARGFWRDPDRYLATYWSRWPGTWVHGDWARRDVDGQWYILGRSDDTLKVAGKRVGPAEVESILCADPRVAEAAVIGVPDPKKGQAMIAFCVGVTPEIPTSLEGELLEKVAAALGRPLRPERAHFVPALPRTRNAKVMRRVLRAAYLGEDPGDVSALENPGALAAIARARGDGTGERARAEGGKHG